MLLQKFGLQNVELVKVASQCEYSFPAHNLIKNWNSYLRLQQWISILGEIPKTVLSPANLNGLTTWKGNTGRFWNTALSLNKT